MKNHISTFGFVALFAGIAMIVFGIREHMVSSGASKTPEPITLKALIARGPDSQPNLVISNFATCENFVYEHKNNIWQKAWLPIVPREDLPPGQQTGGRPDTVQAILVSTRARDQNDLYSRCNVAQLQVLMTNRIDSVGTQERNLLRQSYPNTDFTRCLILHENRTPSGVGFLVTMIAGGSVVAIAGCGLLAWAFMRWRQEQAVLKKPRKKRKVEEDDLEVVEEEEDRPRRRRPPPRDDDYEEDEDRPRKRRPK